MTNAIPHLDLTEFLTESAAQRYAFGERLVEALRKCGFITLQGHAVDSDMIARSYASAKAFFDLPEAEKLRHAGSLRGYTPFGREHAKDRSVPDLKEFWQIGYESDVPEARNIWPDRPDSFSPVFRELFDTLESVGRTLLSAVALGLSLDEDYFEDKIEGGTSLLRLIHYPPIPDNADPSSVRAAAHEDINLLTLLVAAQGAGLEVLMRDGRWVPVNNAPEHLVVDTGDMMARITNGVLPATTHRVVNPEGPNVSRYSMPYFVQPRAEVMLESLKSCLRPGEYPAPPISTGDFLHQRLVEIGLAEDT
ncbi:isopenicillin N synthase family dioxygenase [Hyphobacterium sp.]|uniref:isopenicillin N synthase family dioxygenase n=1 Tax=Hyphobacterium sp. TaxID=2004662 RepID=UPI003B51E77F